MQYEIQIKRTAAKRLAKIDGVQRWRIESAIGALASDPRPPGCRPLVGVDAFRIRIGDYRVVYTITDEIRIVSVLSIGHRRDIYREV